MLISVWMFRTDPKIKKRIWEAIAMGKTFVYIYWFSINQFIYLQFCDFISRVSIYSLDLFRETREETSIITSYIILCIPTYMFLKYHAIIYEPTILFNGFLF